MSSVCIQLGFSGNAHTFTLVNVNAPVVATTSWWLHYTAIGDLIHGLGCKSNKVLEFCRDRSFFLV